MATTAATLVLKWQVGSGSVNPHVHLPSSYPHKPLISHLSLAAPTFETIMEDLDVCAGESPRFAVVVEGKPVPDILWFKVRHFFCLFAFFFFFFTFTDKDCVICKII